MLETLKEKYGCAKLTVQSSGTLNSLFLREHFFKYADLVVAPVLVGGKDTSSLINGESLHCTDQLSDLGVLKLIEAEPLKDSCLRLHYQLTNADHD
jgi:2,5-diamino-6-(ribosylamino)-4(3H)-pyrimidinone 5'-phosphate reductase